MPTCQSCQSWTQANQPCPRCGSEGIQYTVDEAPRRDNASVPARISSDSVAPAPLTERSPLLNQLATAVAAHQDAIRWVPQIRSATPLLRVLDDGHQAEGETYRLRSQSTQIGRRQGEVQIPQDDEISSLHATIERICDTTSSGTRFRLRDLASTNGTFVRQKVVQLEQSSEFIMGNHRYRWNEQNTGGRSVAKLERVKDGKLTVPLLPGTDYQIGRRFLSQENSPSPRHPQFVVTAYAERRCIELDDDPYLDRNHATIRYRSPPGHRPCWEVVDDDSTNGIWTRTSEFWLDEPTEFLCGEQRFLFLYP